MLLSKKKILATEVVALLRLAMPVSLSQLLMVGMTATDTIVAGNAGAVELAGMSLGANVWNIVLLFFMGIGMATQPLIAKKYGSGDNQKVREQLIQSIWMCLLLGLFAVLVTLFISIMISELNFEPALSEIASDYLFISMLGTLPLTLIPAFRGTLEGVGETQLVLFVSVIGFLINIPLDIAFVNGLGWIPPLGGSGCALATGIVSWGMLFSYCFLLRFNRKLKKLSLLRSIKSPDIVLIKKTFEFGLPIGLSICLELSMFSAVVVFISYLGIVQASAHAIAMTIASMSFVLYLGLGQGVTIRASQFLGAHQGGLANRAALVGLFSNIAISLIVCVVFVLGGSYLVGLFTSDRSVSTIAVTLLYYAAMFQVADCLQVTIISILRAYGDTSSPLFAQCFVYLLCAIPAGGIIIHTEAFEALKNPEALWSVIIVSLVTVSIILIPKLLSVFGKEDTLSSTQA